MNNDEILAGYQERAQLAVKIYGNSMAGYLNKQQAYKEMMNNHSNIHKLTKDQQFQVICNYFQGPSITYQQCKPQD